MKSQNKDKSYIVYNNEPLEKVESFKNIVGLRFLLIMNGMNVLPLTLKWERNFLCIIEHVQW